MSGYVRREYPEWSWSFSRQQTFASCPRRYYYNYYRSHNGWEYQAPAEAALAYRLKKLTNLYLVLGDAVHRSAEQMVERIKEGRPLPTSETLEEEIRRMLRQVWISSRDNQALFLQKPNRVAMLHEFYYGLEIRDDVIAKLNERASVSAKALAASPIWGVLAGPETEIISYEQFDTFLIKETPVYAVPDLLFKTGAGQWVIVDWKTGEEMDDNREQMALYALYVQRKHGVPAKSILGRLDYLNLGAVREITFTAEDLQEVEAYALESMAKMRSYLKDPKPNIAKAKEDFPLTNSRNQCLWCNFYELCQEELIESVS